jgi:hypothetical protein
MWRVVVVTPVGLALVSDKANRRQGTFSYAGGLQTAAAASASCRRGSSRQFVHHQLAPIRKVLPQAFRCTYRPVALSYMHNNINTNYSMLTVPN